MHHVPGFFLADFAVHNLRSALQTSSICATHVRFITLPKQSHAVTPVKYCLHLLTCCCYADHTVQVLGLTATPAVDFSLVSSMQSFWPCCLKTAERRA